MAFAGISTISPYPSVGREFTPVSAQGRIGTLINDLRAAVASTANLRNPIGAALAAGNFCDVRGATSFRAFGQVKNTATTLNFTSANPRVALYLVWIDPGKEPANDLSNLDSIITNVERIDQDGSNTDGGIDVPFYETSEPTANNRLLLPNGNWLVTKPLQWTDINSTLRTAWGTRGAAFAIGQIARAAAGSAQNGESSRLVLEGVN